LAYKIDNHNNNYAGRIGINMKITDITNGKSILNDTFSGSKAYFYPEFKSNLDVLLALPSEVCYKFKVTF